MRKGRTLSEQFLSMCVHVNSCALAPRPQDSKWPWATAVLTKPLTDSWADLKNACSSDFGRDFVMSDIADVRKAFKDTFNVQCESLIPELEKRLLGCERQIARMHNLHKEM